MNYQDDDRVLFMKRLTGAKTFEELEDVVFGNDMGR
jgi:hypothetical protein